MPPADPGAPDDVPETTAVPEPEAGSASVERTGDQDEKVDAEELAFTGNDSMLPLVGAGLIAFGGITLGGALLARRGQKT